MAVGPPLHVVLYFRLPRELEMLRAILLLTAALGCFGLVALAQPLADKKVPSSCDLKGELVGDFVEFDAEFKFSTEAPNTNVLLGLQGGYLLKAGDLDGETPIYDHNKDDGYVLKVAKEADKHRLIVNF